MTDSSEADFKGTADASGPDHARPPAMSAWRHFGRDDRGTVAVVFGLALLPMVLLSGMALDYSSAGQRQARLNAIADAAALSTTTPAAMLQTSSVAQTNATAMFNAQAGLMKGVSWSPSNVTVTVTDTPTATTTVRSTTVTYSTPSINAFSALLKMPTMQIGNTSKASSYIAPNIDFYLLLDTSPSMAIPATTAGINQMIAATPQQPGSGCAFACHETAPSGTDNTGNPHNEDNYALARSLNIVLRMDLVVQAVQGLISQAMSTASQNNAIYRVATYTFDYTFNTITSMPASRASNLSGAASDSANIQMLKVYDGNQVTQGNYNNDTDTNFDGAMAYSAVIPNPGQGTNKAGDSPQEVLMIVTDGVIDEMVGNTRTITTIGNQADWCTPLKSRGIRIAVLYTTYNPIPNNAFYVANVAPIQAAIPTAAQACASPGLYFQVSADGDVTAAMVALFNKAVATSHLTL
jgi:Flp pilus assembly protein TadG